MVAEILGTSESRDVNHSYDGTPTSDEDVHASVNSQHAPGPPSRDSSAASSLGGPDFKAAPDISTPYKNCSSAEKEQRILLAIEGIYEGGFSNKGEPLYSIRQAARDFDVPFSTLQGRFRGRKSKTEAHEHQRLFTTAEEQSMIDWIKTLGTRGIPMTMSKLREFAEGSLGHPVGENWAYRFVQRHSDIKVSYLFISTTWKC